MNKPNEAYVYRFYYLPDAPKDFLPAFKGEPNSPLIGVHWSQGDESWISFYNPLDESHFFTLKNGSKQSVYDQETDAYEAMLRLFADRDYDTKQIVISRNSAEISVFENELNTVWVWARYGYSMVSSSCTILYRHFASFPRAVQFLTKYNYRSVDAS